MYEYIMKFVKLDAKYFYSIDVKCICSIHSIIIRIKDHVFWVMQIQNITMVKDDSD